MTQSNTATFTIDGTTYRTTDAATTKVMRDAIAQDAKSVIVTIFTLGQMAGRIVKA